MLQVFFRGDQPHMTAAERANKQNQAQALQDALRKQIEEQRAIKVNRNPCLLTSQRGRNRLIDTVCQK